MFLTRAQFELVLAFTLYVLRNSKLAGAAGFRPIARRRPWKRARKQTRLRRNSRHSRRAIESQSSHIREDLK